MGNSSSRSIGPEIAGYDGLGKLHTLPNDRCVLLGVALQTTIRHPHVLHGVPWKTFFSDFVGGPEAEVLSLGVVVEPVVGLSGFKGCSSVLRLVLLRQFVETSAFVHKHGLKACGVVAKADDCSHLLLVCEGKEEGSSPELQLAAMESWMLSLDDPKWAPCLPLEKTLRLVRSEYRGLSCSRLREQLQGVSAHLKEEAVLSLLIKEELFVQRGCDELWKRTVSAEVWKSVLQERLEQLESRSLALALVRRSQLFSHVSVHYAHALLCDSDDQLCTSTALQLHLVAGEETRLECALRLAADVRVARRVVAQQMAGQAGNKQMKRNAGETGQLRCATVLRGLADTEDRVREQAVLALPRVAEFVERRADLARLLAAVAPLLAKETDDDLRLAALDAAQELLDILGRAALPQDATGEELADLRLPAFVVRALFERDGLQPIDDVPEPKQQQQQQQELPQKTAVQLPTQPGAQLMRLSPRVPPLFPRGGSVNNNNNNNDNNNNIGNNMNNVGVIEQAPSARLPEPRRRSGTVPSPRGGSPRGGSPRPRSHTVLLSEGPPDPPSHVLRLSPRPCKHKDNEDDDSDE